MTRSRLLLSTLMTIVLSAMASGQASADWKHLIPMTKKYSKSGRFCRAGCPHLISRLAKPFPTKKYSGYYVGGGAPFRSLFGKRASLIHGEPRRCDEGTFGVDYTPWYSRVRLSWYHGRRFQDGEGQYEPDHKNNPLSNPFDKRPEAH